MKYTITINQVGIVKAGLANKTDLVDWAIIDYLKELFENPTNIRYFPYERSGGKFIIVRYKDLIKDLPLIKIKDKNAISNRFKKLQSLNLIELARLRDNTLVFRLTNYCYEIINGMPNSLGGEK